jgi:hypothetical protein
MREWLYQYTHWHTGRGRPVSLDQMVQLDRIPGVHVPAPWLPDAADERATVEDVRYGGCVQ